MVLLQNAAAALAALMLAQTGAAPEPTGRAVEGDDIVVTAPGAEEVRAFVEALSAESASGQLARWDRRICPGVIGAREDAAQFIIDRIAVRAFEIGLDVGEPGCRPNILIVVTAESDAMAASLQRTRAASYYGQSGNTRGREAFRDFRDTPRPVRWWHVTRTVTADGAPVGNEPGGNQASGPSTVNTRTAGRIRATTRQDFNHVIVIMDVARTSGVRLGALADYMAMAALAQIDPDAEVSAQPSILNLFAERAAGREGPSALTAWDLAYLSGLYGAPRDARNARQQQRAIERGMRNPR